MRSWFLDILIRLLLGNLSGFHRGTLTKDEEDLFLSAIWQNPVFRKRIADRDAKLVFTMAGGEGLEPEPRDKYAIHTGQRVENLLFARDAKQAWLRADKKLILAQTQNKSSEVGPE